MPVVTALPGNSYQLLRDKLSAEQAFSQHLTAVLERITLDRTALRRKVEALEEQLRLADEISEGLRAELEVLRSAMEQHGLHPERLLED